MKNQETLQIEKDHKELWDNIYSQTSPINSEIQKHYDQIRELQKQSDAIKASAHSKDEELRKKAVEAGGTAGFISQNDRERFNPEIVRKSRETMLLIKAEIMKGNRRYDETALYHKIKSLTPKGVILRLEDTNEIDQALIAADRYIHGE